MKKVAIYARQSLDKEDSFSIEKQIDDCKKRIGSDVPSKYSLTEVLAAKIRTDHPSIK